MNRAVPQRHYGRNNILLHMVIVNIKEFFDMTVFFTTLFIGLFALLSDYPYFKRVKYKKDAAVTLFMAVLFLVLPFVLWVVSML